MTIGGGMQNLGLVLVHGGTTLVVMENMKSDDNFCQLFLMMIIFLIM